MLIYLFVRFLMITHFGYDVFSFLRSCFLFSKYVVFSYSHQPLKNKTNWIYIFQGIRISTFVSFFLINFSLTTENSLIKLIQANRHVQKAYKLCKTNKRKEKNMQKYTR